MRTTLQIFLFTIAVAVVAKAQPYVFATVWRGSSSTTTPFASVGDLDEDGCDDLLVGAPDFHISQYEGETYILSGANGSRLWSLMGSPYQELGEVVAAAGDVNADGVIDFLVSQGWTVSHPFEVRLFSGATGLQLMTFTGPTAHIEFGNSMAGLGDLDGDGHDDFIIGAPGSGANGFLSGSAYVYSGATGGIMHTFNGNQTWDRFGFTVANLGDLNADGVADFSIGAPVTNLSVTTSFPGELFVYSGADFSLLYSLAGDPNSYDGMGSSAAPAGDVDLDGHDDFVVGLPGVFYTQDELRIYSGADGSIIHQSFGGTPFQNLGERATGIGDYNGDGRPDILSPATGDFYVPLGKLRVIDGLDGSEIFSHQDSLTFGYTSIAAAAGDLNGDGLGDFVVGRPLGSIYAFLAPPNAALHYHARNPTSEALALTWHPTDAMPLALTGDLQVTGASAGASGLLFSSLVQIDYLAFGYLPFLASPDSNHLLQFWAFGFDGAGTMTAPAVSRQYPFLAGLKVYLQAFEWSPFIRASNGLRLELAE